MTDPTPAGATPATYSVRDSRAPDQPESLHVNVKDAIAAGLSSGLDVYVHADDCEPSNPLGDDCPCEPLCLSARTRGWMGRRAFQATRKRAGGR